MSQVDQFESAFRSAIRPVYEPQSVRLAKILLVTDLPESETVELASALKPYFNRLSAVPSATEWQHLPQGSVDSTAQLLKQVETIQPDLICTYRNLNTDDWRYQKSIGSRLDTLISHSKPPILIIPHPESGHADEHALRQSKIVLAITDHLSVEQQLIDYATAFLEQDGELVLTHLEDEHDFNRYLDAISKIETIDTDLAARELAVQLLKEPKAFVVSCRDRLGKLRPDITVTDVVKFAPNIDCFRDLVREKTADLLVLHGFDHREPGIHGLAHVLINETRQIPILVI